MKHNNLKKPAAVLTALALAAALLAAGALWVLLGWRGALDVCLLYTSPSPRDA